MDTTIHLLKVLNDALLLVHIVEPGDLQRGQGAQEQIAVSIRHCRQSVRAGRRPKALSQAACPAYATPFAFLYLSHT